MPRYFFHVHDGEELRDHEGTELPNLKAAQRAAVQFAAGMLADQTDAFWNHGDWQLDVADADGLILITLIFTGTIAPAARASGPSSG